MSSAAAFQGEPARPAYATAKAGIGALTRHVAARWGKDGIRCNAVAPGFTATEAIRSVPQWPELEASALRRIRGNRVGNTDDVASLVSFLMSDEGSWINGQVVNIDGGDCSAVTKAVVADFSAGNQRAGRLRGRRVHE